MIDTSTEIGNLMALTEPYLWLDQVASPGGFGHYELRGIVKPADTTTARSTRSGLLDRAEQFIEALADAGWQPVSSFRMEFTTRVRNFTQTLAGVMMDPSEQRGIELSIDLRIGRAR